MHHRSIADGLQAEVADGLFIQLLALLRFMKTVALSLLLRCPTIRCSALSVLLSRYEFYVLFLVSWASAPGKARRGAAR